VERRDTLIKAPEARHFPRMMALQTIAGTIPNATPTPSPKPQAGFSPIPIARRPFMLALNQPPPAQPVFKWILRLLMITIPLLYS
jgi:hypothetical protein